MPLKVEDVARLAGKVAFDEYERNIGVLVSFYSDVNGVVESIEVKVADTGVKHVPADRARIVDGKLLITPEWKYNAIKIIEALDRAYRRMRALETLSQQGDLPIDVVKSMKMKLEREIKELKRSAEEAKSEVKKRLSEIDDEMLRVARAIANLQMLYFSNEIDDKGYTQAMDHLKKLRESLAAEKSDAKRVLEKLEKTLEAASTAPTPVKAAGAHSTSPAKPPEPGQHQAPTAGAVLVKIED